METSEKGVMQMSKTFKSRTLSVSIDCPPDRVYGFVSNPENFTRWATAFCRSIRRVDSGWIVETPQGQVNVRFAPRNTMGVMDHFVTPTPGVEIYVPMRIVANGSGSEVIFTLFRMPGMTDEEFAADSGLVQRDLTTLKKIMEANRE
jgi:hypothetical protein